VAMAAEGAADGASDSIPKVPWPSSVAASAKAHLEALGAGGDRGKLWELLGLAACSAAATWHNAFDPARDPAQSCELWLWITDVLVDQLKLCDVPRSHWPVELQLLGLVANDGCADPAFLTTAARQLEQWAKAETAQVAKTKISAVMEVAVLVHLHAVMVAACCGEMRTLEALIGRIDECVALAKEWGWHGGEGPSSQRHGGRAKRTRARAPMEPVLAAVEAVRFFADRVTDDAFSMETTSEAVGGTPLPPAQRLQQAARAAQMNFPPVWIRDIAIKAAGVISAKEEAAPGPGSAEGGSASKRRRAAQSQC